MAGFARICSIVGANTNYTNFITNRNVCLNVQLRTITKERALEQLGIPPKPKKPLNPYLKFLMSERQQMVAENPQLKPIEVVKAAARRWAVYDQKEKEVLQKAFELELLAYSKKMMMYEQSITPEQRNSLKELKDQKADKMEKLKLKKKTEELGKPRRPPTAFLQYVVEKKFTREKHTLTSDWVRYLAEEWKAMSSDEKFKYQEEVRKLMTRYKKEMQEWEEKMVRQGHLDVVRNRGLIHMKSVKSE